MYRLFFDFCYVLCAQLSFPISSLMISDDGLNSNNASSKNESERRQETLRRRRARFLGSLVSLMSLENDDTKSTNTDTATSLTQKTSTLERSFLRTSLKLRRSSSTHSIESNTDSISSHTSTGRNSIRNSKLYALSDYAELVATIHNAMAQELLGCKKNLIQSVNEKAIIEFSLENDEIIKYCFDYYVLYLDQLRKLQSKNLNVTIIEFPKSSSEHVSKFKNFEYSKDEKDVLTVYNFKDTDIKKPACYGEMEDLLKLKKQKIYAKNALVFLAPTKMLMDTKIESTIVTLQEGDGKQGCKKYTFIGKCNKFYGLSGLNYIACGVSIQDNNYFKNYYIAPDVTIGSNNRIDTAIIGSKSIIGDGNIIGKNVIIGNNVRIGYNVEISNNVVLGDKVIVKDNTVITDNVYIQKNGSIREKVTINSNVIVGEFVTIHDSTTIKNNVIIEKRIEVRASCRINDNVLIKTGSSLYKNLDISNFAVLDGSFGNGCVITNHVYLKGSFSCNCEIQDKVKLIVESVGLDVVVRDNVLMDGDIFVRKNCKIAGNVTVIGSNNFLEGTNLEDCVIIDRVKQ